MFPFGSNLNPHQMRFPTLQDPSGKLMLGLLLPLGIYLISLYWKKGRDGPGHTTKPPSMETSLQRLEALKSRIPPGSWDSHMHVVDPAAYPLAPDALYVPQAHTIDDALIFESSVGLRNIVLVQPSIYGNDNDCMLDALRRLGSSRARVVVAFDPARTSLSTLREWHDLGVRGVRINLQSVGGKATEEELRATLQRYADVLRPLRWVVQVYVSLPSVSMLERIVPDLGVRVCIDHVGYPILNRAGEGSDAAAADIYTRTRDPYDLPGFASLIRLLQGGDTFVKLSGAYRFSQREDYEDVTPIAKEVLRVAGKDRVVFATDWPHTRFEGLDITPWMEKVLEWCGDDDELVDRVFRTNAMDLWGIEAS